MPFSPKIGAQQLLFRRELGFALGVTLPTSTSPAFHFRAV